MNRKKSGHGTPIPNGLGRFRRDFDNLVRSARRLALILGLALWLLPCGRLCAWDSSARTEAISARAEQANESVRNMQSKVDDLQQKINRLEDKINSRDYKMEALERKLRDQDILDRRVRTLESASEDRKLSAQAKAITGKKNP